MSKELLRPRENRCKWFNTFGVIFLPLCCLVCASCL